MIFAEGCALATVLLGFLGIIFKKNLILKILAMDIMSVGVIVYYTLKASRNGFLIPVLTNLKTDSYADPVPQAVILTAIVIGFSIQALLLVSAMKFSQDHPTLDYDDIEKELLK